MIWNIIKTLLYLLLAYIVFKLAMSYKKQLEL